MKFISESMELAARKCWAGAEGWEGDNQCRHGLFEVDDNEKVLRCVGTDGGEPEDQRLYRDWSWVQDELNKLAEENNRLRTQREGWRP